MEAHICRINLFPPWEKLFIIRNKDLWRPDPSEFLYLQILYNIK